MGSINVDRFNDKSLGHVNGIPKVESGWFKISRFPIHVCEKLRGLCALRADHFNLRLTYFLVIILGLSRDDESWLVSVGATGQGRSPCIFDRSLLQAMKDDLQRSRGGVTPPLLEMKHDLRL